MIILVGKAGSDTGVRFLEAILRALAGGHQVAQGTYPSEEPGKGPGCNSCRSFRTQWRIQMPEAQGLGGEPHALPKSLSKSPKDVVQPLREKSP